MKIFNKIKIEAISKAYTEGIYADTPANRKLGRVGMSYIEYAAKSKSGDFKKVDETEDYLNEAKSFADSIVNKGNFINLWGKEFTTLVNTLNKENENLKEALIFVKNEEQYNLLSKKQEKIGSKLRFYRDLKRIADKHLKDEKNISIQEWLKQFLDNKEENKEESSEEAENWSSVVKYKEDRNLAKKAAEIFIKLGITLPKLEHKPIKKQGDFYPVCGFDKNSNTITLNSSLNVTKKGKEYKGKGWNIQDNPIIHELSHYLAYKSDPNGYSKKEFDNITEEDREKISKELSVYASWNQREFNAELISGILTGKKFSDDIMKFSNIKFNNDGKTPEEILAPVLESYKRFKSLEDRINKRLKS